MGGQLAAEALRATGLDKLPGSSRLVLVAMAIHAFDKPRGDTPARVYWLGRRQLAIEVFGDMEYGVNSYGRKAVRLAIRDLSKRGLIRIYADQPGGVTAYAVLPGGGDPNGPP